MHLPTRKHLQSWIHNDSHVAKKKWGRNLSRAAVFLRRFASEELLNSMHWSTIQQSQQVAAIAVEYVVHTWVQYDTTNTYGKKQMRLCQGNSLDFKELRWPKPQKRAEPG